MKKLFLLLTRSLKNINSLVLLITPYMIVLGLLILLPFLITIIYAIISYSHQGFLKISFQQFINFFNNQDLGLVLLYTILVAFITSIICLIIGYPVAYILAYKVKHQLRKQFLWALFIFPIWINLLIRTYGLTSFFHLISNANFDLVGTWGGIVIGAVNAFVPFLIINVYNSLNSIDKDYINASSDLGASNWATIRKIIIPLSINGIFAGFILVFISTATSLVIPHFLGGGKHVLISNVIENFFFRSNNFSFAAAISLIVLVVIYFSLYIFKLISKFLQTKVWHRKKPLK
ncbi:ABC transporter permease [Mycoplasma sp. SG1]|uniref:ABC transporter permease n=1 Tax=Mycoplasma sp. SG1 TaxID=2810348 RepID=UPI002024C33C|nr:ABC transporter permease [Mycoplasma sp. SG1]URM52760.1 ABC transporter permease [Mycoplasma sp. SG1]